MRRVLVIPSATIGRVAGRLETHGRIARGYLGVGLQPVKLDDGVGAMVMSVDQSGPSAAAGIRQGDIIVGWNDEKLSGVRSLLRALGPDSVGSVVDVDDSARRRTGADQAHDRRKGGRVSEEVAPVVVVAIEISDPALADRLASLLGGIAGIRLATPGEAAAVALVSREAQAVLEPDNIELTPRERDVLVLMAEGASNKAIARQLGISVHTAKFHVGSLLDKLDATGRTDAVAHAARRGVIHL